ncbi:hypothetical protein NITGR_230002 [Nitrospina gracilis 3/211]|uniref:Uncharacterized protein n=1 Tax=Nitrospina gracilis (strain 3/211) TaxID=1266370 RepID=M1ZA33_NITG3|nr:hypothetical protein NITGR_230002 [Nitrospina gracilis 3/211]
MAKNPLDNRTTNNISILSNRIVAIEFIVKHEQINAIIILINKPNLFQLSRIKLSIP